MRPYTLAEAREETMANARPKAPHGRKGVKGRALERGSPFRRVIAEHVVDGVEHAYHATKGWRRRPEPK